MSCIFSSSPDFKRQRSAPGLIHTDRCSKSSIPDCWSVNSGWSASSSGAQSKSSKSNQCPNPMARHVADAHNGLLRSMRRSKTEGMVARDTSAQTSEVVDFCSTISPSSEKSHKGMDEKQASIAIDDALDRRKPSKQSQTSGLSKGRNLERKALNVQLLPSELEQVQEILENDAPSNSGSFSEGSANQESGKFVAFLQELLASTRFNVSIGCLIMLNTVFMALELDQHPVADANSVTVNFWEVPRVPQEIFDGIEVAFFVIFGLEMSLRFVVSGWAMFKEFTTCIDMAALAPVLLVFLFDVQSSKHLTLLRVFRLLKLTRISRLIRLSNELSVLVRSIATSLRSLMWIGVLLLIVLYCSAIICTMLIGHDLRFSDDNEQMLLYEEVYRRKASVSRYWGSTTRSMVALFQVFTLDDWNGIVRPVIETHSPAMILFFVLFIFVTTFGLLNLMMGTIVDHSVSSHKEAELEKERLLQDEPKPIMIITLKLFSLMDLDGNGKLSSAEMLNFFQEHNLEDLLQEDLDHFKVKIDYQELLDMCLSIADAWRTDTEGDDDGITMEEFAGAAMRLRGTARSRDLLSVHVLTKSTMSRLASCEQTLADHGQVMSAVENKLDRVLELLSDGAAESLMCSESCDKGNIYCESGGLGTSSKTRVKFPKRNSRSPLRQCRASKQNSASKVRAVPGVSWEDESTSADSNSGKQVTDMEGDLSSPCSISSSQYPNPVASPKTSGERLEPGYEERMAARMQSGMFGHEKVSSFVQHLMTTMPEFAKTQSGAAIKNYTMKRSMTIHMDRGGASAAAAAAAAAAESAHGSESSTGSRLQERRGEGSALTVVTTRVKSTSLFRRDQLCPTEQQCPSARVTSCPTGLTLSDFHSPLPGQRSHVSEASS